MIYFSGFSLANESNLFDQWLEKTDFCVAGFSFGGQKAIEYALCSPQRIDKIQLFSPAFFNDKDEKFKRMQLMFFQKDPVVYTKNFLENVAYPKEDLDLSSYVVDGSFDELKQLLTYHWDEQNLQTLIDKNIKIEIFLGGADKIIDSMAAREFFGKFGEVYFIKKAGHSL